VNSHLHSSLRLSLRDVYLLPLTIFGGLTYLGLPLLNAATQGLMVVIQGFLGTLILQKLLSSRETSFLLVIGPGWVVGSATSFLMFQLLGRNTLGYLAVWCSGLAAFFVIQRTHQFCLPRGQQSWTISQVVGLAALSMSWEFPELLPTAICALAFGLLFDIRNRLPSWIFRGCILILAVLTLGPVMFRQEYWWLVTDDYSLFQLLSQHLHKSGPFADWGLVSFAQYHWLSYGISGLLDSLGGSLAPQVTLSLTVPFVYSLSLGSSLTLLCQRLSARALDTAALTPAWAITAVTVLDWSGTSTAGVYAVSTATVTVAVGLFAKRPPVLNRTLIYGGFLAIVTLTKLGSVFVILIVLALLETSFLLAPQRRNLRLTALLVTVTVAAIGLVPLLFLVGKVSGGFAVDPINPALGWLSTTGVHYVLLGLSIHKLWLIVPLVFIALKIWRNVGDSASHQVEFLFALIPIGLFGIFLDLSISGRTDAFDYGDSNRFQYFSGPMYFVASLGLLGALHYLRNESQLFTSRFINRLNLGVSVVVGLAWGRWALGERLWGIVSEHVLSLDESARVWLGFMSRDGRIGSALLALFAIPLMVIVRKGGLVNLTLLLLRSLVGVSICIGLSAAWHSFERVRSAQEIAWANGVPGSRDVGLWLKGNSNSSDLVATNHLINPGTGSLLTDFSLGYWSEREFYALGPSFLRVFGKIDEATELSLQFGNEPSEVASSALVRVGVKWFIVDKTVSSYPSWFENWNVPYSNERFLIVELPQNLVSS